MSIDNIPITGYLCEKLFATSLMIRKPSGNARKPELLPKTIQSLGENEGNILFIVNDSKNKFLGDDEMKLLTDLLTACKLSMMHIALVNYGSSKEINYRDLDEQFHAKKILAFGVTPSELDLPFTIPFFQVQNYQNQTYMLAPPLTDFINNIDLKKKLWNCLKKIFL